MPELQPFKGDYYLWKYLPSLPASIAFGAVFVVLTVAHTYKLFKTRSWFCIPFAVGGLFEVIGFAGRAASYYYSGSLVPFLIESIFLLLPPALFAVSIYMVLKRVILSVGGEKYSIIPARWITRVFLLGDLATINVQSTGASLGAKVNTASLGQDIVVAGMIMQLILFGVFWVTAVVFHRRFARHGAAAIHDDTWRKSLVMLYFVSFLIMIRSIFRVIEYVMGVDGYPLTHEWTLYVFDSALMILVMVAFYVRYPSALQGAGTRHTRMRSDQGATDLLELVDGANQDGRPKTEDQEQQGRGPGWTWQSSSFLLSRLNEIRR